MEHPGFAIVHVQSPCTTYNDNYEELKGNPKKGIQPLLWDIPEDHDPSDYTAAYKAVHSGGWPLGIIYRNTDRPTLNQQVEETQAKVTVKTPQQLLDSYDI